MDGLMAVWRDFVLFNSIFVSFTITGDDDVCNGIPFGIEKISATCLIIWGFRAIYYNMLL